MKHAFRVASGLDSMVLGEPQILGQMKQAVRIAAQEGTLGPLLNQVFQRTFSVAKEVRTNTEIGANLVSMAAAAVRMAQNIFGDLSRQSVLFIGAGETSTLAATHFAAHKPKQTYGGQPHAGKKPRSSLTAFTAKRSSWRTCPSTSPASTLSLPLPQPIADSR